MSRNYKKLGIERSERSESLQWPLWQQLIWALQGVFFIDKSLQAAPRCVQKEPGWKMSMKCDLHCDLCLSRILDHSRWQLSFVDFFRAFLVSGQGSSWSWCVRACADECFKELLRDLGQLQSFCNFCSFSTSFYTLIFTYFHVCPSMSPPFASLHGALVSQDLVHDAPPRLLDQLVRCGTDQLVLVSVFVSFLPVFLSHWPWYVDMLGILVLGFLSLSVYWHNDHIVRSLPVIFSEVNHEFLFRCRAWEPRWLLPGETIVADEAVTKSLEMECPVILVQLLWWW